MSLRDVAVHLRLVVEVISERRMNLTKFQVGVMPMDFFGVPALSHPVKCDHADLDSRICNDRLAIGIELDVGVSDCGHEALHASEPRRNRSLTD